MTYTLVLMNGMTMNIKKTYKRKYKKEKMYES